MTQALYEHVNNKRKKKEKEWDEGGTKENDGGGKSKFPCDISMCICIITQIGLSPLFFLLSTLVPFTWLFQ
jgi:hypothetical protein